MRLQLVGVGFLQFSQERVGDLGESASVRVAEAFAFLFHGGVGVLDVEAGPDGAECLAADVAPCDLGVVSDVAQLGEAVGDGVELVCRMVRAENVGD